MLLVSLLFLIIIVFTFKLNYNIFFGLLLGYLFAVIGFGLSVIAIEAMIKMKSVAIYYILFFARMSVYCIPIIIYAIFPKEFNIYTIIFGISFFLFSSIISNMLPINVKNRKEIKNARNKLNI